MTGRHVRAPLTGTRLRNHISATLTGNLLYTASQFGMLIAVAQLTNLREVGHYALALAITGPIFMFLSLKLRQAQVTDTRNLHTAGEYFGLRLLTSFVAVAVSIIAGVAWDLSVDQLLVLAAVSLFKAVESQLDIMYGALQREEAMRATARSMSFRAVGGLLVFITGLAASDEVWVAICCLTAFTVLAAMTCSRGLARLGIISRPSFSARMTRLVRLTIPLGIALAIGSLLTNVPRYVLQHFEGAEALGTFAALSYVLMASGTVVSAVGEASTPRLARLHAQGDQANFRHIVHRLAVGGLALGLAGVVGAVALGRPALSLAFGSEYAAHWQVLVILMAAGMVQYSTVFFGTAANAARMFRIQVPINAAVLVVTTVACFGTVPNHGLAGAAWAILVGQVVQALLSVGNYVFRVLPRMPRRTQAMAPAVEQR